MLVSSFKDVEQSPVKTTEEGLGPLVLVPTVLPSFSVGRAVAQW